MADYTVLICNALTDAVIAELPMSTLSFSEVLNGPGTCTVTAPLNIGTAVLSAVEPLVQSIFVIRGDVPVWGGILWGYDMNVAVNNLTLKALGFWSLVRRRRIRTTVAYSGVDQALIAKGIIDDLQAVPGGNMLIDTTAVAAVGKTRDRTYYSYERKNAGEAVEQLADVRGGFDFAIRPAYVSGVLKRLMSVSYPNTGRQTNIVLDAGSNVELLNAAADATNMVTAAHVKGEGDGADALLRTLTNAPLLGVYPLVEDLGVFSDVKEVDTLDDQGRRMLDLGKQPVVLPTVVTYGDVEPVLGSFVVGDQVRLRGNYGLLNIDGTFRITTWSAAVDSAGSETVTIQMAPLEVFANA